MRLHQILPSLVARVMLACGTSVQPPAIVGGHPPAFTTDGAETVRNRAGAGGLAFAVCVAGAGAVRGAIRGGR